MTVLHGEYVVLHDCDKDIYVVYHHGNCFNAAIIKNTIIIFVAAKRWRNLPNYVNPIWCVATACHQIRCMYWGHLVKFYGRPTHNGIIFWLYAISLLFITEEGKARWCHYSGVITNAMASQITSVSIGCSTVGSQLRVTGLCVWNSTVTGEFPAQKASNAENASIWWRHYGITSSSGSMQHITRLLHSRDWWEFPSFFWRHWAPLHSPNGLPLGLWKGTLKKSQACTSVSVDAEIWLTGLGKQTTAKF